MPAMDTLKLKTISYLVSAARRLSVMFPGMVDTSPKHHHWFDFGYPQTVSFAEFYTMFKRNGIARAGVCRPVEKTWQDNPWLLEREDVHEETTLEKEVRIAFDRLMFWTKLKEADKRSRVGAYGGVILRFADNRLFRESVEKVPGGLDGLVELIPFYEGQLRVAEWDTDERSPTYGQPKMYRFEEYSSVIGQPQNRKFDVHPDRVHLWTLDGTVHGESTLEPGYNHLVDIEKVLGAGGEGFWKNAKSAPVLEVDKDASIQTLQQMLGAKDPSEIGEKLDEVIGDWQTGFDQALTLQGITAKTLPIQLPSPEHFLKGPLEAFAASIPIPMKILLGSQTGERASTEDAREWEQTIMARRAQLVVPNIKRLVDKLVRFGVLPDRDWFVDWSDLTEASMDEKIERADKMAGINQKLLGTGERAFTVDEIRETVDKEPLDDAGLELPDDLDEGEGGGKTEPTERKSNFLQLNDRPGRVVYLVHRKAA